MPIEIKMPALSPTMEEGTLAKWLVKAGDTVKSGDILAEIETDKATMEFEAVDEGTIVSISVPEGTDDVKVGTVIATLAEEDAEIGDTVPAPAAAAEAPASAPVARDEAQAEDHGVLMPPQKEQGAKVVAVPALAPTSGGRIKASPLARRLAAAQGVDLSTLTGSGPNGRIVRADLQSARSDNTPLATQPAAEPSTSPAASTGQPTTSAAPTMPLAVPNIPHHAVKLSNIRKTIARRLTESKQQVPHIYLTVDVQLDALLQLRGELNASLEARGVKLSINDLLVKALALALTEVPACNVMFTPDQMIQFKRADVSVAVSTPTGLITPVVTEADTKSISRIATEIKELAALARDGKLKPEQYQGGTASISNMGMYGIKQFDAVINPPHGMILAVGAGERRPWIGTDGQLNIAMIMSVTGSFDHRVIDGTDGAALMRAFKALVERPLILAA